MSPYEEESARAIAALIETYRQGFLHLDPAQIESVWDPEHEPLVYVAQEKKEPTYGWKAIQSYYAALPDHIENILAKEVGDVHFTLNRQAQRAYPAARANVPRQHDLPAEHRWVARNPFSRVCALRTGDGPNVPRTEIIMTRETDLAIRQSPGIGPH